ncbi:MAG: adenylyltransferase/cytidyltransferase family protein [bacterium]
MKTVLVFGVFDPLHEGHRCFFRQAKKLGDYLLVVVARDSSIKMNKGRDSFEKEEERLKKVMAADWVDEARLGNEWPVDDPYRLLGELEFDVLALGYDQKPDKATARQELDRRGKQRVKIVRTRALRPEKYKSSYFRPPANF